jgi:ribosome-associated protein
MEEKIVNEELTSLENATPEELARAIAEVLDSKKGRDIKTVHVADKTVIADWFVLCTGNSSTQVRALIGEVEYKLGLRGVEPIRTEGRDNGSWIILDYASVIVHIFSREARDFYNLDKLYCGEA